MTMRQRVKKLCETKGVSLNKAEQELGLGKGYLSKLDESKSNSGKLQIIAKYLNTTTDYLLTGKEQGIYAEDAEFDLMVSNDMELKKAIKKYYTLDDKKRKHIIELINLLAD